MATVTTEIPKAYALASALRGYRGPPAAGDLGSPLRRNLHGPGWTHRNSCPTGQRFAALQLSADDQFRIRPQLTGSRLPGHGKLLPSVLLAAKPGPVFRQRSWSAAPQLQLLHASHQRWSAPAGPSHAGPPGRERVRRTTANPTGVTGTYGTTYGAILRVKSVPRDNGTRTPRLDLARLSQ